MSVGEQAMDVSSTSGTNFPPKWSTCVRCKSLPKTRNVVFLPCLHICCSTECVNKFFEGSAPWSCPECYQRFNRDMLHSCSYLNTNMFVNNSESLTSSVPLPPCRSCVREAPAYRWCIDCMEYLCEYCTEHHQFAKMTREHTLTSTSEVSEGGIVELDEDLMEGPSERKCSLHSKDFSAFCETCETALCSTCTGTPQHVGHLIKSLDTIVKEFQDEFYSGVDVLKTIQDRGQLAIKALDSKLKLILTEQKNYMHKEARIFFKRLIDALLKREIQLRKDLVEATLSKAKELNIKKAKVSSLVIQCQQYIDAVQEIVEKGSRWNILHQGKHLRSQYKELAAAHATLTSSEKFGSFVEADCNFVIEEKPFQMAVSWIDKICQPVYKNMNVKQESPKKINHSDKGSLSISSTNERKSNNNMEAEDTPMGIDEDNKIPKRVPVIENQANSSETTSKSPKLKSPEKKVVVQKPFMKGASSSPVKGSPEKAMDTQPMSDEDTQILNISVEEQIDEDEPVSTRRSVRVPKRFGNDELHALVKKSPRIASKSTVATSPEASKTPTRSRRNSGSTSKKPQDIVPAKVEKTKGTSPGTPKKIEKRGSTAVDTPKTRRHSGSSSSTGTTVSTRARDASLKREKRSTSLTKPEKGKETKDQKKPENDKIKRSRGRPSGSKTKSKGKTKRARDGDGSFEIDSLADNEPVGEMNEYPILREERMKITSEDENEDYCAICLDGGEDVLICCDQCPRVFHLKCHVPVIKAVPEADWQCLFCTSYEDILDRYPAPDHSETDDNRQVDKVPEREFYIACKFLCELYKVKESLAVRGFYDKMFKQYMNQAPVSLTTMRLRLAMGIPKPFRSTLDIVETSRKFLYQAKMFYSAVSKENKFHLDKFEEKYEEILAAYFPLLTDLKYDPETDKDALPLEFTDEVKKGAKHEASGSSNAK